MQLVGYARKSTEKQDMSLDDQRQRLRDFCDEHDHELVETYDEQVSGSTNPMGRDEFSLLVDQVEQDPWIDGILIWEFDRLARDPLRQVFVKDQIDAEIEILQIDEWADGQRGIPPMFADELKDADDPLVAFTMRNVYLQLALSSMWEMLMAAKRTSDAMQQKKDRGEKIGRPGRGLTTDKEVLDHVDVATEYYPDPDNTDVFEECLRILNRQSESPDPDEDLADGLWKYVNEETDISSPSRTIRSLWERRDHYREAWENSQDLGMSIPIDPQWSN